MTDFHTLRHEQLTMGEAHLLKPFKEKAWEKKESLLCVCICVCVSVCLVSVSPYTQDRCVSGDRYPLGTSSVEENAGAIKCTHLTLLRGLLLAHSLVPTAICPRISRTVSVSSWQESQNVK